MKFINLSNVKLKNQSIEFEFLYKSEYIDKSTSIYLEDDSKRKYIGKLSICKNKVNYSYNNEECNIAKFLISMPILEYGKLKLTLEDNKEIIHLKIRNNKNEIISKKENPYIIFTSQYKIQILEDGIEITKKHFGDKFKYEIEKQVYGIKKYRRIFIFRLLKTKNRKYYLFNDRLLYGDDNAEQLFKYINKEYPEFAKKCYFVLDKNSSSISRIKKIGKVLKYGSFIHKIKFINSRIIVSSHASYLSNCFNPFTTKEMEIYKDLINKKFVFLQHGIIMNDVREYLNRELITADLFVTSTNKEYEYILTEDFMYESNMVIKSGLPRFDRLKNEENDSIILISPTWRVLNEDIKFENSQYFVIYKSLLMNNRLKQLLKDNDYKIKFLLHPVFSKYKYLFDKLANEYIEILESSQIKYFKLFNECSMFITDYSSIHYDVAFLKKPIIYYQFDKEYFFKNHYKAGYFNYEKDGFGKVLKTENQVIDEIEYYIKKHSKIRNEYKKKIEDTFINIDNNNSKRVFDKIIELDHEEDLNYRFNNVH